MSRAFRFVGGRIGLRGADGGSGLRRRAAADATRALSRVAAEGRPTIFSFSARSDYASGPGVPLRSPSP